MAKERDGITVGDTVDFKTTGYRGVSGRGVVERIKDGDGSPFPFDLKVTKGPVAGHAVQLKRCEIEKDRVPQQS